jgi:hypothetical protein
MNRLLTLALAVPLLLAGCGGQEADQAGSGKVVTVPIADPEREAQGICGSPATYARLKELAFADARRAPNADQVNLGTLATHSVVRMEDPAFAGRDEQLDRTVCNGRLVIELPPGTERAFNGQRRLVADVEYSAQPAADGNGLAYQMRGAAPIVEALAGFNLRQPERSGEPSNAMNAAEPAAEPAASNNAASAERPATAVPQGSGGSDSSVDCRRPGSRSEKMVCASDTLVALDRAMTSLYRSSLADAGSWAGGELRQTRDRFLTWRETCPNEACLADGYRGRMQEIRDIMARNR